MQASFYIAMSTDHQPAPLQKFGWAKKISTVYESQIGLTNENYDSGQCSKISLQVYHFVGSLGFSNEQNQPRQPLPDFSPPSRSLLISACHQGSWHSPLYPANRTGSAPRSESGKTCGTSSPKEKGSESSDMVWIAHPGEGSEFWSWLNDRSAPAALAAGEVCWKGRKAAQSPNFLTSNAKALETKLDSQDPTRPCNYHL